MPRKMHRKLKARAAREGMSLSNYLLCELRQIAERPTLEEMRARLTKRPPVNLPIPTAAAVRAERDSR